MTNPVIVFAQFITTKVFSYIRTAKRGENISFFRGKILSRTSPSVTQLHSSHRSSIFHINTNTILMVWIGRIVIRKVRKVTRIVRIGTMPQVWSG